MTSSIKKESQKGFIVFISHAFFLWAGMFVSYYCWNGGFVDSLLFGVACVIGLFLVETCTDTFEALDSKISVSTPSDHSVLSKDCQASERAVSENSSSFHVFAGLCGAFLVIAFGNIAYAVRGVSLVGVLNSQSVILPGLTIYETILFFFIIGLPVLANLVIGWAIISSRRKP